MSQELKIPDVTNAFLPVHILKTMAKIAQIAREHSDIDQDRGVSVRMGIHSIELLIGEAERTRSILRKVAAVPRFCDFHSIHQSSKFELLEIEDTYANRFRTLNLIIADAIKHVSTEYVYKISKEDIYKLKNEFTGNRTFKVSQSSVYQKNVNSVDYKSQLGKFPILREIVNRLYGIIQAEQEEFVKDAKIHEISVDHFVMSQKIKGEFTASILEVVLEGLRWTEPPILDKKDNSYESA
jgi:magnesium chelatase subunit I